MANEIRGVAPTGLTLYARIINSSGNWWNGTTFEAYSAGNYATYDVALTEQGASGFYVADFPVLITTAGTYEIVSYIQSGATPAQGDAVANTQRIDWTGSSVEASTAWAITGSEFYGYVLRKGFKRTDKSTEVYEAITDCIQALRRRFMFDEAEVDTTTTDTIVTLGDYKLSVESNMGLLLNVIIQDGLTANTLMQVSKSRFDELYPDAANTNDRGYPEHFTVYAGNIYIGPVPDQTSYVYRINYSQRAGTVVSSTAGVPFTALYREVLCDYVLATLYHGLEEYDKAGYHEQKFERGMIDVIRRERKNSGQGTFNVHYQDI